MTVHLCDRCGKRLSSDFLSYSPRYQIRKSEPKNSALSWQIWCDICQDCSKELEDWFVKGGKHNEQSDDEN